MKETLHQVCTTTPFTGTFRKVAREAAVKFASLQPFQMPGLLNPIWLVGRTPILRSVHQEERTASHQSTMDRVFRLLIRYYMLESRVKSNYLAILNKQRDARVLHVVSSPAAVQGGIFSRTSCRLDL